MDPGSSQGQVSGGEKSGFSKFVRKASRVLKPRSARSSVVSERAASGSGEGALATKDVAAFTSATEPSSDVAAAAAAAATSSSSAGTSTVPAAISKAVAAERPRTQASSAPPIRAPSPKIELIRSTPISAAAHYRLQEEKARALFAKYNFALEPGEWSAPRTVDREWVEKQVRIRVHRTCHRCETSFGNDKICIKCNHTRCKKCPRYPDKPKDRKERAVMKVLVDSDPKYQAAPVKTKIVPTMMSKGGQEMTRKPPVYRVRRYCHKCNELFDGRATYCAGCKHQRCPNCPREPPKTKKWPTGYPGDVEETFPVVERHLKKIKRRVRWECHECNGYFLDNEKICRGCKHNRCDQCPRYPPKKIRPDPDPAVLRSLEEKMARIQLSPAA